MQRIREGKEYRFLVEKELTLPDSTKHFVLRGPDNNRYLVPLSRYADYGIASGSVVNCRVDRINCKGEVFLEPENPWYAEGGTYPFKVAGREIRIDYQGKNHEVIIVSDIRGNKIPVPFNDSEPFPADGTELMLTVERISKGKIHLIHSSRAVSTGGLRAGHYYEFVIERIERGMNDEEYFVIEDPAGNRHTISKEHYEYYGFAIGSKFRGKVVRYKKNGEKTIEPENPFYTSGSLVVMEVTGYIQNTINSLFTITLTDKFGFMHCIETATPPEERTIRCRIKMIKKGRPLLEAL
jgi:hypothetical protein